MGDGSVIRPGDVQLMSAGSGVVHSEFNASKSEPVHFLQIWIQPDRRGKQPGYQQREFPTSQRRGRLRLVVSPDGADGSLTIAQDARLCVGNLSTGERIEHLIGEGRQAWLQVIRGSIECGVDRLVGGDGVGITAAGAVDIRATSDTEILVFDLP
ncbi:MAG: pirin family protein [Deltaproteobacteria bacterium]|nr:pirin family protein [Deltaproteobacteria bacterium]